MKIKVLSLMASVLLISADAKTIKQLKLKIHSRRNERQSVDPGEHTSLFGSRFLKNKNEDFKPALEYALQVEDDAIDKIANNSEAPTFENTLVEMQKANELIDRVSNVFYSLTSADTNDALKNWKKKCLQNLQNIRTIYC